MSLIEQMPDLAGCFVLTPSGMLCEIGRRGEHLASPELTTVLTNPIRVLLEALRQQRDSRWARLGIVHGDHTGKIWKTSTLALSDDALRRLYPMSASRDTKLTSFQLRNREKSLYRGLELLLDYRDAALPEIPFFCPVLLNRGTTLDYYLPWPDRPRAEGDEKIAVVEVVDLLAELARSQRAIAEVAQYVAAFRAKVVHPERRQSPQLSVLDRTPAAPAPAASVTESPKSTEPRATIADPYVSRDDQKMVEDLQQRFAAANFRDWDYSTWYKAHTPAAQQNHLGDPPSAGGGYQHLQADELRAFERMAPMSRAALEVITARNPVFSVPAGTILLDRGTRDSWNLYLLSGTLELTEPDGARHVISGGGPSARQPVAFLKPRLFSVHSTTPVEFLWLYEPMVEAVRRLHPAG
jgi:hypothetical protein